ncbi:enoyl-CoA hydratase/isomerase family protein [Streptomyces sp. S.PNR 29]|uniref:enoyl-CoA hydratase/isomerase family protein n=1 Tax=Streptomyces sp. S.PNR 29 TaxID=2973805 RepID=UPI0025AFC7B6|nr:enoyl-CoA hydratase/isomerase family protein [Streptomyces sp. S.PNR 29]MDN0193578.1 enoyl-CoA hydratase/isomerase family protein [Streptomyces sp. S.PNR 29]
MAGQRPSFPHIGWDPTPGSVEDTRELAKRLGKLAGELGTAVRELERIECGAWKGKTALAFTEYIGQDVTPLVRKSHESFDKAARALHRWAGELQDFQDEADRLEKSAGEKLDAKAKAEGKAEGKGSKELGEASSAVNEVIQKVHDLEERYKRAAGQISKELDKAADIAPDEPGFWDKLGKGIADAWDATGDWLKEHADLIKMIGDVLSNISAVLGMLAIVTLPFPPLAAIFGTAALIGSGLSLAAHGIAMAAGADVSWMTLGTDALGLLPGIGMFGKGVKVAGATAKVAKGAAAAKVGLLGKGFQATELGASRILMSMGKASKDLEGGLGVAGLVKIGGKSDFVYEVSHASSGLASRMGGLVSAGYHEGQWLGTKGINTLTKWNVDPLSDMGRVIDGSLKIAPKAVTNFKDAFSGD